MGHTVMVYVHLLVLYPTTVSCWGSILSDCFFEYRRSIELVWAVTVSPTTLPPFVAGSLAANDLK